LFRLRVFFAENVITNDYRHPGKFRCEGNFWLSEMPPDPARGYAAVGSKYFPGRDAPWEV
jgi:hypothetical protein